MKKVLVLALALLFVFAAAGCGEKDNGTQNEPTTVAEKTTEAPLAPAGNGDDAKSEGVMTYDEYVNAKIDDPVVIEAFVQGKQSWWEDKATVYLQDANGAYFVYNMECSEEDYAKLVNGTKIKVTGYKAEWSGEIEVAEGATFEILNDSSFKAAAFDVTALLGSDELINHQNKFVSFKDMTIEAADDNGASYIYNWDGSGQEGDDLYFKASVDGKTYTFNVESYLCDKDSDVYKAVKALKVGDKVDMEGFLYWYEEASPQITAITVK